MGIRRKTRLFRPLLACILLATMLPIGIVSRAAADEHPCKLKGRFFWMRLAVGDPGAFGLRRLVNTVVITGSGICAFGTQTGDVSLSGTGWAKEFGKCTGDKTISGLTLRVSITNNYQFTIPDTFRTRWTQSNPVPFPGGAPIRGLVQYNQDNFQQSPPEDQNFEIVTRTGGACPPKGSYAADITLEPLVL